MQIESGSSYHLSSNEYEVLSFETEVGYRARFVRCNTVDRRCSTMGSQFSNDKGISLLSC